MYSQPRNPEADAKFIEAGGLKSWGCFALLPALLVLALFFVLVHVLLTNVLGEPAAWSVSLLLLSEVVAGAIFLWIRRRRRQRAAQEHAWQQALRQ